MNWRESGKSWTVSTSEAMRKALFCTERAEDTVGTQLRERDESICRHCRHRHHVACRERLLQGNSIITSQESGIVRNGGRWLAGVKV